MMVIEQDGAAIKTLRVTSGVSRSSIMSKTGMWMAALDAGGYYVAGHGCARSKLNSDSSSRGSKIVKVVPTPSSLSTSRRPPWA
jgi:hypothetical protein